MAIDPSAPAALIPGIEGHAATTVTAALTAPAMGSGSIEVYATPALVALMEEAAVACVDHLLGAGQATVGVRIELDHKAPSPVGARVTATATVVSVDGRKLSFTIEARDEAAVIGEARHTRIIVDVERFRARLVARAP